MFKKIAQNVKDSNSLTVLPLSTVQAVTRTSDESAKAKFNTNLLKKIAVKDGAAEKNNLVKAVSDGVATGTISPEADRAFESIWKEIKALTQMNQATASAAKGISEGLFKLELRLPVLVDELGSGLLRALGSYVAKVAEEDPLLSKANAESIANELSKVEAVEEIYPVLKKWYDTRSNVVERIKAAGLPLIGNGLLTYLNNSDSLGKAPNIRLTALLGLGAAAIWGRGVPTYVANGLVPVVEYAGTFLGIRQSLAKSECQASFVVGHEGLGTVTLIPDFEPALFTKMNSTVRLRSVTFDGVNKGEDSQPRAVRAIGSFGHNGSGLDINLAHKSAVTAPVTVHALDWDLSDVLQGTTFLGQVHAEVIVGPGESNSGTHIIVVPAHMTFTSSAPSILG